MRARWPFLPSALVLLGFTACIMDPNADFSSTRPDEVLFDRARSVAQRKRFDVARITLQTLVNTYPDSEYAARAQRVLDDPRFAECGGSGEVQVRGGSASHGDVSGPAALCAEEPSFFSAPDVVPAPPPDIPRGPEASQPERLSFPQ